MNDILSTVPPSIATHDELLGITSTLRDNVIFIDNTGIESITTCPWKAYATLVRRRKPSAPSPALAFGAHIHSALEYRHKQLALGLDPDIQTQHLILQQGFENEGTGEDWRSLGLAMEAIRKYNADYSVLEDVDDVILPDGRPAVELPFAIYLGEVTVGGKSIVVIYMGKIDRVVTKKPNPGKYIFDNKTTSMMGESFWRDAAMSPQQRGYCYAYREVYGDEPLGYIINAIACRKPTKTGTMVEFERRTFYTRHPESQLDEWRTNCLAQVKTFIGYVNDNYYPRHYAMHCEGKYGTCHFYGVCEMPASQREEKLMGADYTTNTWSPLKH